MNDKPRLIGIFYIVFGLLGLLGLPLIYLQQKALDVVLANARGSLPEADMYIDMARQIMVMLVPALIALVAVHVVGNILVGLCFIKRKFYYTCFVASIFTCLLFPLGTLLGVFAIVVLTEDETKAAFGKKIPVIHPK